MKKSELCHGVKDFEEQSKRYEQDLIFLLERGCMIRKTERGIIKKRANSHLQNFHVPRSIIKPRFE